MTPEERLKHNARIRSWRKRNPEKNKAIHKKWVAANREKIRQRTRRWYAETKAKRKKAREAYFAARPELATTILETRRLKRQGNPELARIVRKRDYERNRLIDKCAMAWGCSRAAARWRLNRQAPAAMAAATNDAFLQALHAQARITESAQPQPAPLPGGLVNQASDARRGAGI